LGPRALAQQQFLDLIPRFAGRPEPVEVLQGSQRVKILGGAAAILNVNRCSRLAALGGGGATY